MQDKSETKNKPDSKSPTLTEKKIDKKKIVRSRIKRRILKHVWLVRAFILVALAIFLYLIVLYTGQTIKSSELGFYSGLASDFLFTPSEKIESINGRTSVLVLGKGGVGHDAPDLTDTIIFTSFLHPASASLQERNQSPSITLISLPRDIWIPALRAKLNSVYYWGNQRQSGGGLVLSKATVEEIVGQPVQYSVVIDFSGFRKIIDILGGIEVEVERSFIDERYPIPGRENDLCGGDPEYRCRYETISFEKGSQKMDGEAALKFVRSRNAQGDEGTDIAREARQQKILQSIKNKVFSREVLLSPKKLISLKNAVLESTETDIPPSVAAILARRMLSAKNDLFSHILPDRFIENPPISPRHDNLYVFIPANENWESVHEWVKCVLENPDCE